MAIRRAIKKAANASNILLTEAFGDFISEKEATNKSAATINSYKKTFLKWCEYYGEEL